jgi:hypothetical protein
MPGHLEFGPGPDAFKLRILISKLNQQDGEWAMKGQGYRHPETMRQRQG